MSMHAYNEMEKNENLIRELIELVWKMDERELKITFQFIKNLIE